jgi:AcrR family transcriptional regulator
VSDPAIAPVDQRGRILAAALRLMGAQGAAGASMRQVAAACDLNVATLYHYFPSKADLLRSLIEDQGYLERLARDEPPVPVGAAPRERLVALLSWLWSATLAEEAVWRLLVGEAVRGEPSAAEAARSLVAALDGTLVRWLAQHVPELADPDAAARLVRDQVFALMVEHLALGGAADPAEQRAADLAAALLP